MESQMRGTHDNIVPGTNDRWYLGALNDGLFIINQPPSPCGTDIPPDWGTPPSLVLNVTDLPQDKAQAIVDAHNAALQQRVPTKWLPIETAPKDNERPLWIAQFNQDTGKLIALDWDASWEREQESWEIPQVYYIWRSANGSVEEPTHWAYQESDTPPLSVMQQREPEYDRELIADMLGNYANIGGGVFATDLIRRQALLLIAATNAHAAGVHTAKVGFSADEAELRRILGDSIGAKTVIDLELLRKQVDAVSALVEEWRAMRREYDGSAGDALYNCADELEAALKGGKE